jgi:hypothetical protein
MDISYHKKTRLVVLTISAAFNPAIRSLTIRNR